MAKVSRKKKIKWPEEHKIYYFVPNKQIFLVHCRETKSEVFYDIQTENEYYPADTRNLALAIYHKALIYIGEF